MQAMILAAGLGTRLLPHTLIRPKPLFPILNQPLLLLTIKRLQMLGFDHIVVNCHHLREHIVGVLDGVQGVTQSFHKREGVPNVLKHTSRFDSNSFNCVKFHLLIITHYILL